LELSRRLSAEYSIDLSAMSVITYYKDFDFQRSYFQANCGYTAAGQDLPAFKIAFGLTFYPRPRMVYPLALDYMDSVGADIILSMEGTFRPGSRWFYSLGLRGELVNYSLDSATIDNVTYPADIFDRTLDIDGTTLGMSVGIRYMFP
jgi:hypothetical protein